MKILIATLSVEIDSRYSYNENNPYPIGLGYIYTILEDNHHSVNLLFLNNFDEKYSERRIFKSLLNFKPDIVAFQIMTMNRVATIEILEKINIMYPHIKVIIGGIHTSIMYSQILLKYKNVIAVLGEGEKTILELINSLEKKQSIENIHGLAFIKNNDVYTTPERELIFDLESIPELKHEVFFNAEKNRTVGHIITSRGCPFDCSFCCLKIISKRKYRERNIDRVVDEIINLKRKFNRLKHICIHDDTFLLNNSRVVEFCKKIINANLGITFECSARVKPISDEMFYYMQKAGFKKIMFGLETGSPSLLRSIKKGIVTEDVINLFYVLKKYNFIVTTFLMCGFPGESDKTIEETIDLVQKTQKIKYNWIAGIGKLWVYPGTEIYHIMKDAKAITDDYWMSSNPVPYFIIEHPFEKLVEFENRLLDNLSLERILTKNGFVNHFLKMPFQIMKFLLLNPYHFFRIFFMGPFYKIFYRIKKLIKKVIRWDITRKYIKKDD